MDRFTETIKAYMEQQEMVAHGDRILAGLSGGADSVCLLRVLCSLREEMQLTLLAVHVNHGIRGEEAEADAGFCEDLCKRLDIPFRLVCAQIPLLAAQTGCSEEEAGRNFRLRVFEEIRREEQFDRIAAAHHADDNAETLLLNLSRGTGLAGLCGMQPVNGRIIRPLLCVNRAQIMEYLTGIGQDWCTDSTNADPKYLRNRIRHSVMPALMSVNPRAVSHLNRTADILRRSEEYIEKQVNAAEADCLIRPKTDSGVSAGGTTPEVQIHLERFCALDALIRERILLDVMEEVCGSRKDLGTVHVEALERLSQQQIGRRIDLPHGMRAQRIYGLMRIYLRTDGLTEEAETAEDRKQVYACFAPQDLTDGFMRRVYIPGGGFELSVTELPEDLPAAPVTEKACTNYADCDKIRNHLCIRTVRRRDRIMLDAQGHHKSLWRYLMDRKIPADRRDGVPVAADGEEAVLIAGRIGYEYRISRETRRVLKITVFHTDTETEGAES